MLADVYRNKIAGVFEKQIKYPADCDALSEHIFEETGQRVSSSTLKRLYGFNTNSIIPRKSTLDILAEYMGEKDWDTLVSKVTNTHTSEFMNLVEVDVSKLSTSQKIKVLYEPQRELIFKYKGNFIFTIVYSKYSKLQEGDLAEIHFFVEGLPLIVNSVERNSLKMGKYIAGKISGINSVEIL